MSYEKCTVCGNPHEHPWSSYAKCEKCRGIRTKEDFSKLSVEEQIRTQWKLARAADIAQEERYNLIGQCKHPELTKKHLRYDRWLDEVVDINIHSNQEDSFVWCVVCGHEFGWGCPQNPKGYCEYPSDFKEEGVHGCSILYCVHCKKPKNRFIDLEAARGKVAYERPKDEIVDDIDLLVVDKPVIGKICYLIGNFRIDRDQYWFLTDAKRQALHDTFNPGSKAIPFDPKFAEKYGKNPEGPF
jgi:hypothetical protein